MTANLVSHFHVWLLLKLTYNVHTLKLKVTFVTVYWRMVFVFTPV